MKKSRLMTCMVVLAIFPAYLFAQQIQLPAVEIRISTDIIPHAVKSAAFRDFGEGHKPIAWITNETLFNASEWAHSIDVEKLDVYNYALHSETSTGCTLDAVYTANGTLINSREYVKNFKPDMQIMMALQGTQYRDWNISKNFLVKTYSYYGSEKQRIGLVMQKGNDKKTLLFDNNARMISNLEGEHMELAEAVW